MNHSPASPLRLVIIGGVAAGASAAARARRLDESALITVIERGPDVSFANCGLPYHIGGEIPDRSRLALHTPESLAGLLGITVRSRTEAVSINRTRKSVTVRPSAGGPTEELPYDKLVLAPGSTPLRPPLPGIDDPRVLTLRNLQDMDRIKASAASAQTVLVVGAGFIGLEMAEQLHRLGKRVSLVELADQILPQLDREMVAPVEADLRSHAVELVLGDGISSFQPSASGLIASLRSGRTLTADLVILSIGVQPESTLAAAAGLGLGARGTIRVNAWMQTDDPDIYAAGDAVEAFDRILGAPLNLPLGGPANRQGRLIADHIFTPGMARSYPGHLGTAIVRVFDTIAGITGWNEKRLVAAKIPYEVTTVTDHQHAGYFPGATPITVKILWSPEDGRLLGGQAVGADGVDKRLDVLATALAGKLTVDDLADLELAYAPPFGSARDVVNTAGFAAQNQRRGLARSVRKLPADHHLLDVRPAIMAEVDPIPGARHIPLNELRRRTGELDPAARWVAVCALGKSSYFASRLLSQKGYDIVSLAGGWRVLSPQLTPPTSPTAPTPPSPPPPVTTNPDTTLDCCGLSCPGPLLQVKARCTTLAPGQTLAVTASDPGFARDIAAFCRSAGHELLHLETAKGLVRARLRIASTSPSAPAPHLPATNIDPTRRKGATAVVFSGEMDKVMGALVIANGAAALGSPVTLFFTFWGINALRREQSVNIPDKTLLDRMFGLMLPRGLAALPLSKMNFAGAGARLMKHQMASKNLPNLPGLLGAARLAGVRLVACTMAMEAMGIRPEELIDGVELGGVADYLESAERSGTNLFI